MSCAIVGRVALICLAVAAGTASAAGGIFDGCKVMEDKPGEERIHCGDEFRATTSVEQPVSASEALIDLMIRSLKEDRKAPSTVERTERVVGGVKRRGLHYVNTPQQGGIQGVFLLVPASAGKVRLIGCEEPAPRRCDAALEALLHGSPAANQAAPQEDGFAGRPLKTEGCRAPQPRRLECEATQMHWEYPTKDDPQGIDWLYEPMRKAFAQQGTVTELPVARADRRRDRRVPPAVGRAAGRTDGQRAARHRHRARAARLRAVQLDHQPRWRPLAEPLRSGLSLRSLTVRGVEQAEFLAAPVGCFVAGRRWLVWCADERLCGAVVWGQVEEEDVQILVGMMGIAAHLAPSFQVLTDIRLVEKVDPAAFGLYAELLVERVRELGARVAGHAVVRPGGVVGSAAAGLHVLVGGVPFPLQFFTDLDAALRWLGGEERLALGGELAEQVAAARRNLRRAAASARADRRGARRQPARGGAAAGAVAAHAAARAARRRHVVPRRGRGAAGARRPAVAPRRTGQISAIALEVGCASLQHFSTLFRKATGETPSQWRARRRSGAI